jgi:ATP phosphoribosyltransferase regulatory subunit
LPVASYHASGQVYRLPPRGSNDPVEHQQIGFEWFGPIEAGKGASPEEDADALTVALEAANAGGATGASVRFGDVAIFRAVIDELGFSPQWKDRLRRAFSRRKGPRELLEGVANGQTGVPALAASIGRLAEKEAVQAVEQMLADMGAEPVGRSIEDIAGRLRDKARDQAPSPAASAALIRYLGLTAPAAQSVAVLHTFAADTGLKLTSALDAFSRRLDLIAKASPPFWSTAVFSAEVGRRFEYYDGFVFELARDRAFERPIVSGGRYDGLITRLSAGQKMASAIGAALRTDRLSGQGAQ